MKDVGPEMERIRQTCNNVRLDASDAKVSEMILLSQLAMAVQELADVVERIHQSLNNRK